MNTKNWDILSSGAPQSLDELKSILLRNRNIEKKESEEFLNPIIPNLITLKKLGIAKREVDRAVTRILEVRDKGQQVIIYGDYDADGVCASAILWETLYSLKVKILPYLPDRFSEGYGINRRSIRNLKKKYPDLGLIITVDNGIVAGDAVAFANSIDVDVIITDHHEVSEILPEAYAIIHTKKLSGSGVSWIFSREILKFLGQDIGDRGLELAAIGIIADQLALVGSCRSFVKYGLLALQKTSRPGLLCMYEMSAIDSSKIGIYEVSFILAPRINSAGRMTHAIDSLRLICTKDKLRALQLSSGLEKTNLDRQEVVESVVQSILKVSTNEEKAVVVADLSYHEGVIGLAASKIVEKYYKPAIVIAKGEKLSKASARSIKGFNIIEAIRSLSHLIVEGGGHEMAAGFTIETVKIEEFTSRFYKLASEISEQIFVRKLVIDCPLNFDLVNWDLLNVLDILAPFGIGNSQPVFITKQTKVVKAKKIGREGKHVKLVVGSNNLKLDAIAFGFGEMEIAEGDLLDISYCVEKNVWNGQENIQLRIKDIQYA